MSTSEYRKAYQKKHYLDNIERYKQRTRDRKKRIRKWYNQYKSKLKCSVCSENSIECLCFHHIDPTKKEIEVGLALSRDWSIEKIEEEMKKCIVLCLNCHAKEHARLRNNGFIA